MAIEGRSLKESIESDMRAALKAGNKGKLGALRLILAAIKQIEIDERTALDDEAVIGVLGKMLKQRKESIAQYQAAGREDLADAEALEVDIIEQYLPAALNDEQIKAVIDEAVSETGASTIRDMGRVMAKLKPQLQGRADMSEVSAKVKQVLA